MEHQYTNRKQKPITTTTVHNNLNNTNDKTDLYTTVPALLSAARGGVPLDDVNLALRRVS